MMPFLAVVNGARRSPQEDTAYAWNLPDLFLSAYSSSNMLTGWSLPPPTSSNSPSPASNSPFSSSDPNPSPLPPPPPPSALSSPTSAPSPGSPETKISLSSTAQTFSSFSTVPVFVSSSTTTAASSTAATSTTQSAHASQPPASTSSSISDGAPFSAASANNVNLLKIGVPALVGGALLFVVLFLAIKCLYVKKRKARELRREQKGKGPLRSPMGGGGAQLAYDMVPVTVIKDDGTIHGREWKILGGKLPRKE